MRKSGRLVLPDGSAPWRTVGSILIAVTAPTMAKALMPQSRGTISSGVPTNILGLLSGAQAG